MQKKRISISDISELKKSFAGQGLNTVCQSAKCPNIGECFKHNTATFLIMGKHCSRNCSFCAVEKQKPQALDPSEPSKIAKAVQDLGLSYAVITSVTRDDLPDGGANHFAKTISEIKRLLPDIKVEVLTPDFFGRTELIDIVLRAKPDVFSHNIEMVPSLYPKIRNMADYNRSLSVLKYISSISLSTFHFSPLVKTGIMVGLGETFDEIKQTIRDIKNAGADILTIGQYLAPTKRHWPVAKEYSEEEFKELEMFAKSAGIKNIVSGRYVRSSYMAGKYFQNSK